MFSNIKYIDVAEKSADMIGRPYLLAHSSLRTVDWRETYSFLQNNGDDQQLISPELEVLCNQKETNSKAMYVKGLLTRKECTDIVDSTSQLTLQELEFNNERKNLRLVVFDEAFAKLIWHRLEQPLLSIMDNDIRPFGFDVARGSWKLSGINEAMRLNKYDSDGNHFFSTHRDAQFCPSGDKRSVYTLLIYLNDNFNGGETKFYFPKDTSKCCKNMTIDEELKHNEGLKNGYNVIKVKPKCGDAVVFSQNILHEGINVDGISQTKYIIKTDVLAKRIGEMFGFSVCDEEKEDYLKCLNLFRTAQQLELTGTSDSSRKNGATASQISNVNNLTASECYEKCLSIRYAYPTKQILKKEHVLDSTTRNNFQDTFETTQQSIPSIEDNLQSYGSEREESVLSILPAEVWLIIMKYVYEETSLKNLVKIFPALSPVKRQIDQQKLLPKVVSHTGVFTQFLFSVKSFVLHNIEGCMRVAALQSVFLLGNSEDSKSYTVKYDRHAHSVTTMLLRDVLGSVFFEEPLHGVIFKVKQQNDIKNPLHDFYHSVDRRFMATCYEQDLIGVDLLSELRCEVDPGEFHSSFEFGDDVFTFHKNHNRATRSHANRCMINILDRTFKAATSELSSQEDATPDGNVDDESYDVEEEWIETAVNEINFWDADDHSACDFKLPSKPCPYKSGLMSIAQEEWPVGAAVIRKLNKPVSVSGTDYCICQFYSHYLCDKISSSCSSETFNHVIMDFDRHGLFVEKKSECCMMLTYLKKEVKALHGSLSIEYYKVDISCLEQMQGLSFNHASCNCGFPDYDLNEYVNISNYPYLNHIHVAVVIDGPGKDIWAYTCYGGIVAL